MPCEADEWVENAAFLRRFRQRATRERIPLSGTIELTYRCNLHCAHCYLGPLQENAPDAKKKEMETARWIRFIDEITAAGCLNLWTSGYRPRRPWPSKLKTANAVRSGKNFSNATGTRRSRTACFYAAPASAGTAPIFLNWRPENRIFSPS